MVEIRKTFSWWNVYVDNVLVLTHLTDEDVDDVKTAMDNSIGE